MVGSCGLWILQRFFCGAGLVEELSAPRVVAFLCFGFGIRASDFAVGILCTDVYKLPVLKVFSRSSSLGFQTLDVFCDLPPTPLDSKIL